MDPNQGKFRTVAGCVSAAAVTLLLVTAGGFTLFQTGGKFLKVHPEQKVLAGKVTVEKINYKGWANCYRLSNGIVDAIVTADVGPRIIRFGFVGEENEFKEFDEMVGKTGGNEWRPYGGHRLWHAPEMMPRTYFPDNSPVRIEQYDGGIRAIQPTEPTTGIQKEIDIRLQPNEAHATVSHRLHNMNAWPVELAPWALTVAAPGGRAIIPVPPRGPQPEHLLPTSAMALWAYTDLSDQRFTWGRKYILLRQDKESRDPEKIGLIDSDGWIAYARAGHLFVKKFDYFKEARYPDFGCTVETFTNKDMLEVETLGPFTRLDPNAAVEHVEQWFLFRDVPGPKSDSDVDGEVLPRIKEIKVH